MMLPRIGCSVSASLLRDQKILKEIYLETRIQGKGGLVVLLLAEQFVSVMD